MKFKKLISLLGIVSTGFVLSMVSASAATIYENPADVTGGGSSDLDAAAIQADDFSLTSPDLTIRSIYWRGFLSSVGGANTYEVDNFTLRIYADSSGPSGSPLHEFSVGSAVNRTDTGLNLGSVDVYDYSADITPTTLTAGVTYWLSIFNDTTTDTDDNWGWMRSNSAPFAGNNYYSTDEGASWIPGGIAARGFAFRLDDAPVSAVPVPAAVWLMGSALAGLLGFSRRKPEIA